MTQDTRDNAPPPLDLPELPTKAQVADLLQVSMKTVERLIEDGTLTAHKIGPRLTRVDRGSVLKLLSTNRSEGQHIAVPEKG